MFAGAKVLCEKSCSLSLSSWLAVTFLPRGFTERWITTATPASYRKFSVNPSSGYEFPSSRMVTGTKLFKLCYRRYSNKALNVMVKLNSKKLDSMVTFIWLRNWVFKSSMFLGMRSPRYCEHVFVLKQLSDTIPARYVSYPIGSIVDSDLLLIDPCLSHASKVSQNERKKFFCFLCHIKPCKSMSLAALENAVCGRVAVFHSTEDELLGILLPTLLVHFASDNTNKM
jgi:hypothetical protein